MYANLLTWDKFEIPSKKQMESSMFDLPLPFNPVIALNCGSNPETVVRVAYDLKPSITICLMYIFKQKGNHERKTSIGFSDARRLAARSWRQNLPRGLCWQWIVLVPSLLARNTQDTQPLASFADGTAFSQGLSRASLALARATLVNLLVMYQWNRSLNIAPWAFEFLENFCSNYPSRGRKAVQMPHCRSISSDQMPHPRKLFSSFYYAPEAVNVTTLLHAEDNTNGSWIPSNAE